MNSSTFYLKVKVIWLSHSLGLAIDNGNVKQQYFLTPYYFWPQTNAWEYLILELASKPWLNEEEKIATLQVIAYIMNYWLLYRNIKNVDDVKKDFQGIEIFYFD